VRPTTHQYKTVCTNTTDMDGGCCLDRTRKLSTEEAITNQGQDLALTAKSCPSGLAIPGISWWAAIATWKMVVGPFDRRIHHQANQSQSRGMEAKITKKVDIHPRYSHLHPDIEVAVEANPVDTWAKRSVLPIPSSTAYSGTHDGP